MMRLRDISVLALILWFGLTGGGISRSDAAEPTSEPLLRIETGMHTAVIKQIDRDASGRILATASEDKTVRVWDTASGQLLTILRPPVDMGVEGQLYSVAVSPDGETVCCAGWTGWDWDRQVYIYVFERQSGRLERRVTGLSNGVYQLAFSPEGQKLAVGLGEGHGLRVFDTQTWTESFRDDNYQNTIFGLDFSSNGRLAVSCLDGFITIYDADMNVVVKKKAPEGNHPYGIAFSPDGKQLAVGYYDTGRLSVLSAANLTPVFSPDTKGIDRGNLWVCAWSRDGRDLLAGGTYDRNGRRPIVRWSESGRGPRSEWPGPSNTLTDLAVLPEKRLVYGAADPSWGLLDSKGRVIFEDKPHVADFRALLSNLRLNEDASAVQFGFSYGGKEPARFSIPNRQLTLDTNKNIETFKKPILKKGNIRVTDWEDRENPKLNGRVLKLQPYEKSRCLALQPDGAGFVLGADFTLRLFNQKGLEQWSAPTPGTVWAVNVAPNGKLLVAALADGTLRWHRLSDGRELLALFPDNDRKRWVLWSPSGYYDASPGGEDLIGWHINRGKDHEADFFSASRFRDVYYRPDVVAAMVAAVDESEAVRRADADSKKVKKAQDVRQLLPPVVRILYPPDGAVVSENDVTIRYLLRSPQDAPPTTMRIYLDGRPLEGTRGLIRQKEKLDPGEREIKVTIPEHDVLVSLIAENQNTASEPALLRLKWEKETEEETTPPPREPKLLVLSIGAADYEDDRLDLTYPAKDARDFAEVVARQKGLAYKEVDIKVLTDQEATKDHILDALEWIETQTTSSDVAMVFLAGHGVNDDVGDYYFLPRDVNLDRLRRSGLLWTEIVKTVSTLPGKSLVFIDTCHAGNVMGQGRGVADINALVNQLSSAEKGVVVFASSTGKQYSLEDESWQNGAFTKALVEGLSGKADYTGNGVITIKKLDLYLSEQVKALTDGRQTPTTTIPLTISDFTVAMVPDNV